MKEIQGQLVYETIEEIADPKHTALMIIDIQNDNSSPEGFVASHGANISHVRDILPNIKKVLAEARRLAMLVIFTRETNSKDGTFGSGPMMRMLSSFTPSRGWPHEAEGTWGNEVLDELEPRPNERQIIKYRPSAFIGTPLDMMLKSRGIQSVVVVGSATEMCVETTVRDLQQYGYYPVVLRDCVASSRPDCHEPALLVMSARFDVIASAEVLDIWHSASESGS